MNTEIFQIKDLRKDKDKLEKAAKILKRGGLVAIPTETVYGLAADCLNQQAVAGIFAAKGRPGDNPLIVHLADIADACRYAGQLPDSFYRLAERFCPGPLTMIVPKGDCVPFITSGGLDTVALRFPAHPVARELIRLSGCGLAAPSANRSGSPSPTTAQHCIQDMSGRIDAVVDGGNCPIGVESTVVSLVGDKVRLLRPGAVTPQQLAEVVGEVEIDPAVTRQLEKDVQAASPGMKYKHYAPSAKVVIVQGSPEEYRRFVNDAEGKGVVALCFAEDAPFLSKPCVVMGREGDELSQAQGLFACLRRLDELGARLAYARCPSREGMGLAVYNRLLRAAAFETVTLGQKEVCENE